MTTFLPGAFCKLVSSDQTGLVLKGGVEVDQSKVERDLWWLYSAGDRGVGLGHVGKKSDQKGN